MSDATRRRVAAILLVVVVALVALAVADVGPFSDPPTEEERAQSAVEDFFGAAADGDSKQFCGLLTADARQTLRVNTAQKLQTDELPGCADILDVLAQGFEGSSMTVTYVSVSGDRARVEGSFRVAKSPAQPRTVLLVQEDDEWRISDPG